MLDCYMFLFKLNIYIFVHQHLVGNLGNDTPFYVDKMSILQFITLCIEFNRQPLDNMTAV